MQQIPRPDSQYSTSGNCIEVTEVKPCSINSSFCLVGASNSNKERLNETPDCSTLGAVLVVGGRVYQTYVRFKTQVLELVGRV